LKKSEIGCEILSYLEEHPDAQDTLQGIMEWWLPERAIRYRMDMVSAAVAELIENGLILEVRGGDGRTRYRLNKTNGAENKPEL